MSIKVNEGTSVVYLTSKDIDGHIILMAFRLKDESYRCVSV